MRKTMKKLTQGATRLLVLALGLGLVSTVWAAKLGDGITAYYDCETLLSDGTTIKVKGKKWNSSSESLDLNSDLEFGWVSNNGGIGNRGSYPHKFNNCYSGGGTVARCYDSTVCAGLCPGEEPGDWTFSFWVVRNNAITQRRLFVNCESGNVLASYSAANITSSSTANTGFGIYLEETGRIGVRLSETTDGNDFTVVSIVSLLAPEWNANTWHNVIVSRSGDALTLYVDGEVAGTATMTTGSYISNPGRLTMAENSSNGIGQENGADDFCVWNRALTSAEVLAIADGSSPISDLASIECALPASLEETGGYVKKSVQLAFKNATLDDITAETLTGRITGGYINTKGASPSIGVFATPGEGVKTCEAQVKEDNFVKSVNLRFTQVGDNVFVSATAGNKSYGTIGETVNSTASTLVTDNTSNGYGLYNLRLPRTYGSIATVVWEKGEFGLSKVGSDGRTYKIVLPNTGIDISSGNMVVSSDATTGATIDISEASTNKATVLIKYTSLYTVAGKNVALATIKNNANHVVGIRTKTNNSLNLTGYYDGSASDYDLSATTEMISGSGYFLFSHNAKYSEGWTRAYSGRTIATLAGGQLSTLRWSSGVSTISSVAIAGPESDTYAKAWSGAVVEKVALFVGNNYTATDVSTFKFPTTSRWQDNDTYAFRGAGGSNGRQLHLSTLAPVDCSDTVLSPTVTLSDSETSCHYFAKLIRGYGAYKAPGCALFYDQENYTASSLADFGPLTIGGLYVTSPQTSGETPVYYTITSSTTTGKRNTELGDPTGKTETYFVFDESFIINRIGASDTEDTKIYGTANVEIARNKTFNLNAASTTKNKNVVLTAGTSAETPCLKMSGEGQLVVDNLTATGAILDYTALAADRATEFIKGALVINDSTTFKFPANAVFPYPVASSISGLTDVYTTLPAANYTVGGVAGTTPLLLFADGTAIPSESAQTATITADGTYTLAGLFSSAPTAASDYTINVNESATLDIPSDTTVLNASFNVAEGKTLTLTGSALTATLGISVTGSGKVYMSGASRFLGTIKGDGRVVFEGVLPVSSLQTSFKDDNNWTGTVEIKNYTETADNFKIINLNNYGNVNSAVALNCVTSTMYAVKGTETYPPVTLKEIEIGEGGWTDYGGTYNDVTMLYTAKLTGHGPLAIKTGGSGTVKFIGEHTFDGSVTMDSGTGKQLAFMRIPSDPAVTAKAIFVAEGLEMSVASGKTWTADGGFVVNGTLNVNGTLASSANSVSGSGTVVFTGKLPPSAAAANAWWKNANWTGKVEIKNYVEENASYHIINLNNYGNSNSTVALNGVKSTMYAQSGNGNYPAVTLKEIEIGEGGWSDWENGSYGTDMLYTAKLTGHGPITVKSGGEKTIKFVGEHTFDGSVAFDENAGKQVAFMRTSSDLLPTTVTAKAVIVAGRLNMSIASGKTWTAPGGVKIDGSLTVFTDEAATATSVTPTAYRDGAQIETSVNAVAGTTTYSTGMVVSDNQASMDAVTVIGGQSISGSGGAYMASLTIEDGATLTYDPVITPLRVESAPVFNGTGKLKLASRYASVTCGKFHLVSYPSSASVSGTLANVIDSSSFAADVSYAVTEETVGSYHQLVLKVGDYDTNAKDISIAQFGDSITEGIRRDHRGTPNYRIPLMQLLEAYGYRPEARGYRSVGSTDANGVPADENYKWHTGISAQRIYTGITSNLRAGFMESIEAHLEQVGVTDIITLKIGTNDSLGGETADNMFEGWSNLVWKIVRMRPTSKIVVCTPVTIRSGEGNAPGLRSKIADYMALTYAEGGFPAGQVTMVDGFVAVTDDANYYLGDNVHPNWNGHMQLANAWLPAVTNAFESMKVNDVIVHAEDTYTAQPPVASAETVAELASYREGYVKLATFSNYNTKLSTWGETPYYYVNNTYKDTPMGRVAYFVARKTTASPDTRYVWVDMDADSTTGTTLADFGVPTDASVNGVVNNLHIYSNSSAIENVAPTVSGVKGTLMRTEKGVNKADGISTTLAPTGPYDFDWNDTIDDAASWGVMNIARIFDGATPTNHRKLLAAQMLFDFNGFNADGNNNALGIGDFAVHGPYNTPNGTLGDLNLNWTFKAAMPTMDATALETGVIEIWGKQVYTATMGESYNFSRLTFSPTLPDNISACDLIINVTDNVTLTFDSAKSVGSITFNIAENKTFTLASESNLTVGKVTVNGPGKLQLSSSGTFGWMDVLSNATLGFANGATLGVSGALYVASGATLTLEPAAISTASSTIISAASISGNVSVTLPSEAGVDYSTIATETSYKVVRTPNVAFSYDGTIGATPTGWVSSWAGEGFGTYLRVGPNSTMPVVYEVRDGKHPYADAVAWTDKDITFSIYADISQVSESGRQMLVGVGRTGEVDNRKFLILYREGASVKFGVWDTGKYSDDGDPTHLVGTAATVAAPVSAGYHLYTATFNHATGDVGLYLDNSAAATGSAGGAIEIARGLQIGSILRGVNHDDWSRCSGNHGLTKGVGMAFAAIRGYDAVLAADNVEALAQQFPATDGSLDRTIHMNQSGNALTIYSSTMAAASGCSLGISQGTLTIPSEETVSVPSFLVSQNDSTTDSATININGTLNINSTSVQRDVMGDGSGRLGVVVGYWKGGSNWNIPTGGRLLGENAYVEFPYSSSSGVHVLNVNGGEVKIKGFFPNSNWTNKGTINLTEGGTIDVSAVEDASNRIIISNFGYGTYRQRCTTTVYSTLNFSGTQAQPTTLDPYGYTMTLYKMAGAGYVTVADSSDLKEGKVVFTNTGTFTGYIVLTDENSANVDLGDYTGKVLCQGTAAATIAKLDRFTGTVYFTGNVDATGVDLSGATVNIADNCTFTADAGKEGALVLGSGAAVTLKVDDNTVKYEGYVPTVSGSGTVGYYNTTTSAAVCGADYVNGNNLLPYYNVWSASATASENTLSANASARWKSDNGSSGVLPADDKNVAFKLENGQSVTLLVDATKTFNDIQVYGNGMLIIQQSGDNILTVGNGLYTTANARVQIDSGLAFASGAKLDVESAYPQYVAINCGTAESPFEIPVVTGSGLLIIGENKGLTTGSLTVGTLTVDGKLTLTGAGSVVTSASINSSGSVDVSAGTSLTVPTLTVNGTLTMGGKTLAATTVTGTGRVEYTNKLPDASSWATGTASTGWRGTVAFSMQIEGPNLNNYGNAYSTVALTGVSGSNTYLPDTDITTNVRIEGSVTINNGNPIDADKFSWTHTRVVIMPSLEVNGALTFRKVGNTQWLSSYSQCYYYTRVLKCGTDGSIDIGNQFGLRVDKVDFAEAPSVSSCLVPISLTKGGDGRAYGVLYGPSGVAGEVIPVTVNGVDNGQKLVHATVNETTGLYLAVASVTENETTSYYPSLAAAKEAVGNDSATINLLENTSENVALAVGQSLVTGGHNVGTVSTSAENYHVVNNAGVYTVALDQFAVTIPYVANTTVSVSYTSGGVSQTATAAGNISVDYGTDVTATWTAASGYKITAGASQTLTAVTSAQTLELPTVDAMGATVSDVNFTYGADYTNATVTAIVAGDATGATLNYGNAVYTATSFVNNGDGTSTATFENVVVPARGADIYAPVGYEITAKNGESTITTTGGEGSAPVTTTTAWINENATTHVGGSWSNPVTYTGGAAAITNNRFVATTESISSRVVMEFNVCFTDVGGDVSGEAQGALKLGEVGDVTTFMVLTNGNQWVAVSNDALTPDPAATNKVVMTFDYADNTYGVSVVSVEDYVLTNSAGSARFPLAAARTGIKNIDFAGIGTLVSMKGDQIEGYMVVDANGERYASIADAIAAYLADPTIAPLRLLHSGAAPDGWEIVTEGGIDILKKIAKGLFFMAY